MSASEGNVGKTVLELYETIGALKLENDRLRVEAECDALRAALERIAENEWGDEYSLEEAAKALREKGAEKNTPGE